MEEDIKLYSNTEISIATLFAGPLAAGYLMKKNFQSMGERDKADVAFRVGVISTIVLFVGLLSLPEGALDKLSQTLIPAIYTTIITWIVNKTQGPFLKAHKENGGQFHSGWKAAKIGFIALLIMVLFIFAISYISGYISSESNLKKYDKEMAVFFENERKSLEVFSVLDTANPSYLNREILKDLELWRKNKQIVQNLETIPDLPDELHVQNQRMLKYCDLRIQHFALLLQVLDGDIEQYLPEIQRVTKELEEIIE